MDSIRYYPVNCIPLDLNAGPLKSSWWGSGDFPVKGRTACSHTPGERDLIAWEFACTTQGSILDSPISSGAMLIIYLLDSKKDQPLSTSYDV